MELRGQLSIDLAQNLVVALVFPEAVKRLTLALQFQNQIIGGFLPALSFRGGAQYTHICNTATLFTCSKWAILKSQQQARKALLVINLMKPA